MRINRCRTLEDQIRKLKRDMNEFRRMREEMNERFDRMDERFNRLESRFDKLESKVEKGFENTGKSFLTLVKPLKVHCGDEGTEASKDLKDIWKKSDLGTIVYKSHMKQSSPQIQVYNSHK